MYMYMYMYYNIFFLGVGVGKKKKKEHESGLLHTGCKNVYNYGRFLTIYCLVWAISYNILYSYNILSVLHVAIGD